MSLLKLDIYAVRNIQQQSIILAPKFNFFFGENASGKSAIIEAIFILGRARSFRSATIKQVINFEQDYLIVSALASQNEKQNAQLGIRLDGKNIEIRINQQPTQKRSDLAYALPLQLIHPKSYELLDAGPQLRREFLDWGVFHDDQAFLHAWRNYKKALSQRNSVLKTKRYSQIDVWNKELVCYGTIVNSCRKNYIEKFIPAFIEIVDRFITIEGIDVKLESGWDNTKSFQQALIDDLDKDLHYGFTHSGPHRGDVKLLIKKRQAKDIVSRGQLKLLVVSLKLAQVQVLNPEKNKPVCILIDDFAAELDRVNRAKILNYLAECGNQVLITATNLEDFGDLSRLNYFKVFHVEHGCIKQFDVPCE